MVVRTTKFEYNILWGMHLAKSNVQIITLNRSKTLIFIWNIRIMKSERIELNVPSRINGSVDISQRVSQTTNAICKIPSYTVLSSWDLLSTLQNKLKAPAPLKWFFSLELLVFRWIFNKLSGLMLSVLLWVSFCSMERKLSIEYACLLLLYTIIRSSYSYPCVTS